METVGGVCVWSRDSLVLIEGSYHVWQHVSAGSGEGFGQNLFDRRDRRRMNRQEGQNTCSCTHTHTPLINIHESCVFHHSDPLWSNS